MFRRFMIVCWAIFALSLIALATAGVSHKYYQRQIIKASIKGIGHIATYDERNEEIEQLVEKLERDFANKISILTEESKKESVAKYRREWETKFVEEAEELSANTDKFVQKKQMVVVRRISDRLRIGENTIF